MTKYVILSVSEGSEKIARCIRNDGEGGKLLKNKQIVQYLYKGDILWLR